MSEALPSFAEDFTSQHHYPNVVPIEDRPDISVGKIFEIPGLVDQMRSSPDTLFIDPNIGSALQLGRYLLRSTNFSPRPDWSVGREDSFHQVFFGELELTVDAGQSGESTSIPVAVKPYLTATRDAVHEYIGFQVVNETGFIESFHPLGLWVDNSGKTFLLTRFEEDVVSLDNVAWDKQDNDPLSDHYAPFNALTLSANILALLHIHGFSHGDAQIKNMAADRKGVRLIDLTQLRQVVSDDEQDPELLRLRVTRDLKMLIQSVNERHYLEESDSKNRRQIIEANMIAPYLSAMRHPSANSFSDAWGPNSLIDAYEIADAVLANI